MMTSLLVLLVAVISMASASPRLQFGRLIGGSFSGPYYENENMTITCEDQPSSVGILNSLSLFRIRGQEREPDTLIYKYFGVFGDPNPREEWSGQRDSRRYSVDQKALGIDGAKFRIIIRSLDCNDGGQYWCTTEGQKVPASSTSQNLTISAAPKNLGFGTYTHCRNEYSERPEDNIDCGRSNCQAMARYGEVPSYTCSVSVPPANYQQYSITWYKRIPNFEDESLIRNVTPSTIKTRPDSKECKSMQISSTILYAIQANDHNLVIECRLTGPRGQTSQFGDNSVMNASVAVCVTGLEPVMDTTGTQGLTTDRRTDEDANTEESSNAGMIAGIVIGVIALIVLVVLLVYFLWYRRRDEGETYNTKDDNAMSSEPGKPENASTGYDGNNKNGSSTDYSVPQPHPHPRVNHGNVRGLHEPLHYAELDLVRNPVSEQATLPREEKYRDGDVTPYAAIRITPEMEKQALNDQHDMI